MIVSFVMVSKIPFSIYTTKLSCNLTYTISKPILYNLRNGKCSLDHGSSNW
ncbi:hypothetical protein RHMOL_Rhmol06G0155700 [Rhododendron molle]|uniref:Uncharacterized protein n=1 Tax=Rhododendron molle TaxID=49168 RepID=A0ACC0NCS9_RHOML|nr:hypothetical protein RHMOL_Rhmol06G0155700 [Rhododendron molle]